MKDSKQQRVDSLSWNCTNILQQRKGKGIFFNRWPNRRRLTSLLGQRFQKSPRFVKDWTMNRRVLYSSPFSWKFLSWAVCPVNSRPAYQAWGRLAFSSIGLTIVHSKKTEPWQPQLVGWYERRPLHGPNKVFACWSKKKTTTFGAKTIVLFKNLGTGCCSQPLPSEHRCVWPLKVLLSCYWAFSGFVAVIFQGGVVG